MSAVKLVNVTKRFGKVVANYRISLEIEAGEIHTLLGENGAGKTTLVSIISGLYRPDEGEVYIFGRKASLGSPKEALNMGVFMVPQTPKLVDSMTVLENLVIGLRDSGLILPTRRIRKMAEEKAREFGLKVDLDFPVWRLSASEKKRVEILKALVRNARILILDEPTQQLSPAEKEELFSFMRRVRERGGTVIFITHKMREALSVSDRISVLRKGRLVATLNAREANPEMLTKLMFGESFAGSSDTLDGVSPGEPILIVRNLYVRGDMGELAVKGASLELHSREILGIAGVAGNGQKELIEAIYGLRRVERGSVVIRVGGREIDVTNRGPKALIRLGFAYIPEDRIRAGIVPSMTVAENLILRAYWRKPYSDGFLLKLDAIRRMAEEVIEKFSVAAPSPDVQARHLSGGNIQKLIVARELREDPRVVLAAYPTLGLDVASTQMIRRLLVEKKRSGAGIILLSEDLDEILALSDRIIVMYEGRIVGEFTRENADAGIIGKLMLGG